MPCQLDFVEMVFVGLDPLRTVDAYDNGNFKQPPHLKLLSR